MKSKFLCGAAIFAALFSAWDADGRDATLYSHALLPIPVEQSFAEGVFVLDSSTGIMAEGAVESQTAQWFGEVTGLQLQQGVTRFGHQASKDFITLSIAADTAGLKPEGYSIDIGHKEVAIRGNDRAGLFYGVQTLLQMLPPEALSGGEILPVRIPCQHIVDYPRFAYRGMMLDVARTFSDTATVKRLIDRMAAHKLNRLHWHLTDDEGWRIESHPRLAEVGGFRGGDSPVKHMYGSWGRKYGGYYTQQQIREIVDYAAQRHIEIIPEIELPGHSRAAARVYPEILCGGEVDSTAAGYDMRNVWCAAKESNYEMLDDIIREVSALFPSPYIHVGGDEVLPGQWTACPDCKALMEAEGYEDVAELTGHFMRRIGDILAKYGKKQAVWNEAVESGKLPEQTLVYAWENVDKIREVASQGYPTVMVPAQYFYFDMKYSAKEPGLTWAGEVPLDKTYSFDIALAGLSEADAKHVVGVQGTLFTELFLSQGPGYLDHQVFPRLCALAELAWSPQQRRDWADFNRRLESVHLERLAAMGIGYRKPPTPAEGADSIVKLKPAYTLTSNIPAQARFPYRYAADHKASTYARSERTCKEGDWFLFTFEEPLDCDSIVVRTGFTFLPRYNIGEGVLEVSYDGVDFEVVEPDFEGCYTLCPGPGLKAIRIKPEGTGNGEKYVYLHDLLIY